EFDDTTEPDPAKQSEPADFLHLPPLANTVTHLGTLVPAASFAKQCGRPRLQQRQDRCRVNRVTMIPAVRTSTTTSHRGRQMSGMNGGRFPSQNSPTRVLLTMNFFS